MCHQHDSIISLRDANRDSRLRLINFFLKNIVIKATRSGKFRGKTQSCVTAGLLSISLKRMLFNEKLHFTYRRSDRQPRGGIIV